MGARLRLALLVISSVFAAWLGMHAGKKESSEQPTPVAALPPVAAPAGLMAEAALPLPDATWKKTQATLGGMLMLAPATFGGLLASLSRVPDVATLVDGSATAFGVMDDQGAWVVAARAQKPQGIGMMLTMPVAAKEDDLEVHVRDASAVGVAGHWIIVGSGEAAILRLGPYAYRTLPTKRGSAQTAVALLENKALTGPVQDYFERRLSDLAAFLVAKDTEQRLEHGGRAPDLADTKPIIDAIEGLGHRWSAALGGMQSVEVLLDVSDGVDVRARLVAPQEGPGRAWVDALVGSDATELRTASADALATVYWNTSQAERNESAKAIGDVLAAALGSRVPGADEKQLSNMLVRSAGARRGWGMAEVITRPAAGVLLRLSSSDAPFLAGLVQNAVDVVKGPGWTAWEQGGLGVTKIERKGSGAIIHTSDTTLGAEWAAHDGELDVACGLDAASALAATSPATKLSDDPKLDAWLRSLRGGVALAIITRPLIVSSNPKPDTLTVALLHEDEGAELRLHGTGPVVRQLLLVR